MVRSSGSVLRVAAAATSSPVRDMPSWSNPTSCHYRHGSWRRHPFQPGPQAFGPRSRSIAASRGCWLNKPRRSIPVDWATAWVISASKICAALTPPCGSCWICSTRTKLLPVANLSRLGWPGYAAATGWAGTVVISTRMRMRRWCIPPSIRGQTGAEDPPVAGVRRAQRRPRLHRRGRLADRYGIAESSRHPGAILAGAPVAAGAPGVIPASVIAGLLAGGLADVLPDLPQ